MRETFQHMARHTANVVGSPWAFLAAIVVTVVWASLGPFFDFSDTWQLFINTGTTIATFLVVFLLQHTQNHDTHVLQLKLDELIRALEPARNELVNMESMTDEELDALQHEFEALRKRRQPPAQAKSPST